MMKFRNMSDATITKLFVSVGGGCIAAVVAILGLAFVINVPLTIYFGSLSAAVAALVGSFYAIHRVSKRPRFMFSF